jgi:hypothetical protein
MRPPSRRGTRAAPAYHPAVSQAPARESRPIALIAVYSWDMLRGLLALLGALAPFSGATAVGTRSVDLTLPVQLLAALSSAAFAVVLISVATNLTGSARWVFRLQIAVLVAGVAVALASLGASALRGGVDAPAAIGTGILVLFDLLVVALVMAPTVRARFHGEGGVPRWLQVMAAFWLAGSLALTVLHLAGSA